MAGSGLGWRKTVDGRGNGGRRGRLRCLGRCGRLKLPGGDNEGEELLAGSRADGAYALGVALRT
jgi:hypothetical protein